MFLNDATGKAFDSGLHVSRSFGIPYKVHKSNASRGSQFVSLCVSPFMT
jgi:hypothetical protein